MHRIHGGEELDIFAASTRLDARWEFFKQLRDLGRSAARNWLAQNYDAIGQRSTLDLQDA
jgi:NTE family protein